MRNMVTRKIKVTKVNAVAVGMIDKELVQIPLTEQKFIGTPKQKKIDEAFADELQSHQREFDINGKLLITSNEVTELMYGIPTAKFVMMAEVIDETEETAGTEE